jgi:hypothetical protein
MERIATHDLYESCYYALNKCDIETVEVFELDGKVTCRMVFKGDAIGELQTKYFHGKAEVNLFDFRRMYGHLTKVLSDAKREYKRQQPVTPVSGGAGHNPSGCCSPMHPGGES